MPTDSPFADRLDWALPDFTRIAWVSDGARTVWEPRFDRLRRLTDEVEWRSVCAGIRNCAVKTLTLREFEYARERWAEHGLVTCTLGYYAAACGYANRARPPGPGENVVTRVVIGRPDGIARFVAARDAGDEDMQGTLLGYPVCCQQSFIKYWVEQRCVDMTWPMARATAGAATGNTIDIEPQHPSNNLLWRWVGLRAVPHLPCAFDCAATVHFAHRLRDVAENMGAGEELAWQDEIFAWPVEWSALHGIAEIKTPILKVSASTDATAGKYVVRWHGSRYPKEGANGLGFPFAHRRKRPLIATSAAYRRGLRQPLPGAPEEA